MTGRAPIRTLREAVAAYLSTAHRDHPGAGCYMAALGPEIARQSPEVRRSFTEIVRNRVSAIAALLPNRTARKREDEALGVVATMVGAMILSRAVDDPELSERILAVSRARLLETS